MAGYWDSLFQPIPERSDYRTFISVEVLVHALSIDLQLAPDGAIEMISLDIELAMPGASAENERDD